MRAKNLLKTALATAVAGSIIIGCDKTPTKPEEPTPTVNMQLTLEDEVPYDIPVEHYLHVDGNVVLDSINLTYQELPDGVLKPEQETEDFTLEYQFTDTTRPTLVTADGYLNGDLFIRARDTTRARCFFLRVDAPDSVGEGLEALLSATVIPAAFFRTLRLTTEGLDTTVNVPQHQLTFTLQVPHQYATAGDYTVQARARFRLCSREIIVQRPIHVYPIVQPGEIRGSLDINPSTGVWPLQTEARIIAYPQNLIASLRFNKGEGPDTVIVHPDSLTIIPLLYGSRGEYLARATIVGQDSSIILTQPVQAVNAQHYLNFLVDPAEGTEPLLANILASFGTTLGHDSLIQRLNVDFSDGTDTTINNPQSPFSINRTYMNGEYLLRAILTARDTIITQEQPLHVSTIPPITYNASLTVTPNIGNAPLVTNANIQVQSSRPDTLSILYNKGFGPDTSFCLVTPANILIPATYDIGNFLASASIQGKDSLIILEQPIQSRNTPPQMTLPTRTAYEDSSMQSVDLDAVTSDAQSPDSLLTFAIQSQNGPATASLDNHVLRFALQPDASGPGNVSLRVTDPHGAFTDRTLNYNVLPMTDLRISIADLETLEPLSNGIVTINGQDYLFGDMLHTQVLPGGIIPVRAVHTLNNNVQSFERTADINTASDRDTTILVSTYDALQEQNISPFRYWRFIAEARNVPIPSNPSWFGLAKINFSNANQGFENGGYTWWIGKTNPNNGLQWTDQEQILQENLVLNEINSNIIHPWARPTSHRATLQDSSYYIEGYGTTHDGLLPSYKSLTMSFIATYDRNFDGILESAYMEIVQYLPQNHIIAENLSALAFPNEVGTVDSTLTPYETVLHQQSQRSTMSRADIKALNEAINLPDAEALDRAYHIRQ
ncbi:MAG: hypothetical protein V1725_08260 [archaeon]